MNTKQSHPTSSCLRVLLAARFAAALFVLAGVWLLVRQVTPELSDPDSKLLISLFSSIYPMVIALGLWRLHSWAWNHAVAISAASWLLPMTIFALWQRLNLESILATPRIDARMFAALGTGATFALAALLYPPVRRAFATAPATTAHPPLRLRPIIEHLTGHPGRPHPRALLVEDNAGVVAVLRGFLQSRGWTVEAVPTLHLACECLHNPPDCMLLDLTLPDGQGERLLQQVRERSLDTRVVVITGSMDADRLTRVQLLSPAAVLHKPVMLNNLINCLEPLATSRRPARVA